MRKAMKVILRKFVINFVISGQEISFRFFLQTSKNKLFLLVCHKAY